MKKTTTIIAALSLCAVAALAALDTYDSVTLVTLGAPRVVDGSHTNAAVDVATAKGIANVLIFLGPAVTNGASYECTATLQHSTASGGTYTTVSNAAGTAISATTTNHAGVGTVTSLKLEAEQLKRYVRLYIANENDTGTAGAVMLYSK
jgi:hypothetical protein